MNLPKKKKNHSTTLLMNASRGLQSQKSKLCNNLSTKKLILEEKLEKIKLKARDEELSTKEEYNNLKKLNKKLKK